jgi:hypothetical protein
VAYCSVSISGASLSHNKVIAASEVSCCHVSNTGGSLSWDNVWVSSVVAFCCVFVLWRPLELHQCLGILILSAICSCRIFKCRSSLFVARGGGDLGCGGITMNCHFFRSPCAGAIRIVEWGFYTSGSIGRRSNTLLSALP